LPIDEDEDEVLLQIIVGDARQNEDARLAETRNLETGNEQAPPPQAAHSDEINVESVSARNTNPDTSGTVAVAGSNDIDESIRCILGDLEVPEGIDPSFLAALPSEMREEVIAEHLRLQRLRQRTQQTAAAQESVNVLEVSPEFLAALPPNIQEEVLAEQRIEQQRQAAAAANPADPVDAAAFFQNLQPSLRQAVSINLFFVYHRSRTNNVQ
jgi:hypothetical protein